MDVPPGMGRLPTFVALETLPVLEGTRTGATIRLDETYFDGVLRVLDALDGPVFADRIDGLRTSFETFRTLGVDVSELATGPLLDAAAEMREALESTPELEYLQSAYPGSCFVVPQLLHGPKGWFEAENRLRYGVRVFFFPSDEGPTADELIEANVNAVIDDTQRDYERRVGRLLGYPDCCVERFLERASGTTPPEVASVEPLASLVEEGRVGTGGGESVEDVLPEFFANEYAYAFFSREFFPGPACGQATELGRAIFEGLAGYNDALARDFFRLNFLYCYAIADAMESGATRHRPRVGAFGREHSYVYLPLTATTRLKRYR